MVAKTPARPDAPLLFAKPLRRPYPINRALLRRLASRCQDLSENTAWHDAPACHIPVRRYQHPDHQAGAGAGCARHRRRKDRRLIAWRLKRSGGAGALQLAGLAPAAPRAWGPVPADPTPPPNARPGRLQAQSRLGLSGRFPAASASALARWARRRVCARWKGSIPLRWPPHGKNLLPRGQCALPVLAGQSARALAGSSKARVRLLAARYFLPAHPGSRDQNFAAALPKAPVSQCADALAHHAARARMAQWALPAWLQKRRAMKLV